MHPSMPNRPAHALAIRLSVLGATRLAADDTPAGLFTARRPLRLLAYLVLHRRDPVLRDTVAVALWPDDDKEIAHANLRRHLYLLAQALPPSRPGIPWITSDVDRLQLNPEAQIAVDADEFERLVAAQSYALAAERYTGDLFESLYDDWVLEERERLRLSYLACLGETVSHHRRRRDFAKATHYAQRLLGVDPWREDAMRQLMSVRYEAGDAAGALAEFDAFAKRLRAELGVAPMEETRALGEAIAAGRPLEAEPPPAAGETPGAGAAAGGARNNLPPYLTAFIGRAEEVSTVKAMVNESRLVSVVGAGGIGKTRVAVEVAANVLDDRTGGVWFVDFAPISDPHLIPVTVATAMELQLPPNQKPADALAASLKSLHTLLVFDNCEHLLDAIARLVEKLIATCPGVRVLTTSREPLGMDGEAIFRLETLDDDTAVALFTARATQADRRFALAGDDRELVVAICRRLDGIALAIELAASRAHVMSLKQLLGRLDERLELLTSGSRTALPRQQTLRTLIDWSYNLLSGEERAVFRRLAVFAGGFTLEAAIAVAGSDAPEAAADRLFALIAKSMLVVGESGRYGMLDSIREYALERLGASGEAPQHRSAHARYFAGYAQTSSEGFGVDPYEVWYGRFSPDIENFRAALDWSTQTDPATAARIVGGLIDYWVYSGLHVEGLRRTDAVLEAFGSRSDEAAALPVWVAIARLACWQPFTEAFGRRAIAAGERALEIAAREGDVIARAHALRDTSTARRDLGIETDRAARDIQEAGVLFHANGKTLYSALAVSMYGTTVAYADPQRGRDIHAAQAAIARTTGWLLSVARMERSLAQAEYDCGNIETAIALTKGTIAVFRTHKLATDLIVALIYLSTYQAMAGRHDESISAALEALDLARDFGWDGFAAWSCQALALSLASQGRVNLAARLLGFVDASYDARGVKRVRVDAAVHRALTAILNERLDAAELERETAFGRALNVDAVILETQVLETPDARRLS
jgi:predicted ATPase/DNA-binding SARP family transcriptional activator